MAGAGAFPNYSFVECRTVQAGAVTGASFVDNAGNPLVFATGGTADNPVPATTASGDCGDEKKPSQFSPSELARPCKWGRCHGHRGDSE